MWTTIDAASDAPIPLGAVGGGFSVMGGFDAKL
jgi:hypothetical protein